MKYLNNMNNLPTDILLYISNFLTKETCCKTSDLFNFSLSNSFFFHLYKEKNIIHPRISNHNLSIIYNTKQYKYILSNPMWSCYKCGLFNYTEVVNIVDALEHAVLINPNGYSQYAADAARFTNRLSQHIHFKTLKETNDLRCKVNLNNHLLNFNMYGRCCSGTGSTLYIKK